MSLINRKPRSLMSLDPFADLDSWTDQLFGLMRGGENHFHMPATDIHETAAAYEISAELPGLKKEDIKVSLDNGVLTIEGETRHEEEKKDGDRVIRRERHIGKLMRRFALGPGIDESAVKARFENGVLHLSIPKQTPSTPETRQIEIR